MTGIADCIPSLIPKAELLPASDESILLFLRGNEWFVLMHEGFLATELCI